MHITLETTHHFQHGRYHDMYKPWHGTNYRKQALSLTILLGKQCTVITVTSDLGRAQLIPNFSPLLWLLPS